MYFIGQDIRNQNAYLIYAILQWFKCRTAPNGLTLCTKTSQTFKMIKTHFYCLYFIMTGSIVVAGSHLKV